jgi:hypothetical protein
MTYQAFILEEHNEAEDNPDDAFGLQQWMVWVQSPAGAWLLLQGNWPTPTAALRFIDRMGYQSIESKLGLSLLDKQMDEHQRSLRPTLHLRSVH